ncbi:hypothetical protein [Aliiroseovarius subalbicans]|uniref:hypothetical protein n=1 Tax=Aliiroseovarius subalbicans TaxID=2925840 RepID=UPI001F5A1D4A|nr:hypothetical protein [Aliiroseovarius subalbicans]MCI2398564.1 hypothetical protein [Aliiroseovarius subalbicans]
MQIGDTVFIGYPHCVHWKSPGAQGAKKGKTAINQLLWGDWARVLDLDGSWIKIRTRGRDGWVRGNDLQTNRILEVNFVDVGQGDGAHIQTPDDRALVVDAGEADNMYRFLRWRFGRFQNRFDFEAMVISHPDKDHYQGFSDLFEHENVGIGTLFHNCIVEQVQNGSSTLGMYEKPPGATKKHVTGLVRSLAELRLITDDAARRGRRLYPNLMRSAVESGRVGDILGLLASDDTTSPAYLPGFAPQDGRGMVVKVLGPLPTHFAGGLTGLPGFGSTGKTKNGHSVVLQIEIGDVRIQLGGDLNAPAQDYLLERYTGLSHPPHSAGEEDRIVTAARDVFEADITKACHHGSPDVAPAFMRAVNPLVTVVSSGDNEPHAHPRPDTLGMIGRYGRGDRPLIFSTELARSARETIKHPNLVRRELRAELAKNETVLADPTATQAQKDKAEEAIQKSLRVIERSVANYGMINLRTDGRNVVMAQRLERDRSKSVRWDVHQFEPDQTGRLQYLSRGH